MATEPGRGGGGGGTSTDHGGGGGVGLARKVVEIEDGWREIAAGIAKVERILGGEDGLSFTPEEYMNLYSMVVNMCTQPDPHNYSEELYARYEKVLVNYLNSPAIPCFDDKDDEFLLREYVHIWKNYLVMFKWLRITFSYLDRFLVVDNCLDPLKAIGFNCFRLVVHDRLTTRVAAILIKRVREGRSGKLIDYTLVKNVIDIYVDLGLGDMSMYKVLEDTFLRDATEYYSMKSPLWIVEDSYSGYMIRVEKCLQQEERLAYHFHSSTKPKLMEAVQKELLVSYADRILKDDSKFITLLREEKVDDLSRMFSLFSRTKCPLIPTSEILKKYLKEEAELLLEEALGIIRKSSNADLIPRPALDIVKKVIDLYDQHMTYVTECFQNHDLFQKALKEVFTSVWHKNAAGGAVRELFIAYCDNILNQREKGNLRCEMMEEEKVKDLLRMFRLASRLNGVILDPMSKTFSQYVRNQGMLLLKQANDGINNEEDCQGGASVELKKDFVRAIIKLLDKCMSYTTYCFQGKKLFDEALEEAFIFICDQYIGGCPFAEVLADFVDDILQKGERSQLSDVEEDIRKAVFLVRFVSEKDIFLDFHRNKLGRRLLFSRSSFNNESFMISELKCLLGFSATSKMELMLKDIETAAENQTGFDEYISMNPEYSPPIDFNVTVLRTGSWPAYRNANINLPQEMVECMEAFSYYYYGTTKYRKLTWFDALGSCTITGNFNAKPIDLIVTTYQASVLLLFNDVNKLSCSQIMEQLNLPFDDAVTVLQSLSSKFKILQKRPRGAKISLRDVFQFNSNFTDEKSIIEVPLPSVRKKIFLDEPAMQRRIYIIEASIVRIMKANRIMTCQNLLAECAKEIRKSFKPDLKTIKRRIEDLVKREYLQYLEPEGESPASYRYMP